MAKKVKEKIETKIAQESITPSAETSELKEEPLKEEISPLDGIPYDEIEINPGETLIQRNRELTIIPIGKPKGQTWFTIHKNRVYTVYLLRRDNKDEFFLVTKGMVPECGRQVHQYDLYLGMNYSGNTLFFYPINRPDDDKRKPTPSYISSLEVVARARDGWIRAEWDKTTNAWVIIPPEEPIPLPEWPELSKDKIFALAFKGAVINNRDHPILKDLRGKQLL